MIALCGAAVGGLVAAGTLGALHSKEKEHTKELKRLIEATTKQYLPPHRFFPDSHEADHQHPIPEKRRDHHPIPDKHADKTTTNVHMAGTAAGGEPQRKEIDY